MVAVGRYSTGWPSTSNMIGSTRASSVDGSSLDDRFWQLLRDETGENVTGGGGPDHVDQADRRVLRLWLLRDRHPVAPRPQRMPVRAEAFVSTTLPLPSTIRIGA